MTPPIPRIVHQTFRDTTLPPELLQNVRRLVDQNPGWTYRFYDDAACRAFVHARYSARIVAAYDSINPRYGAARADFFRYLLMYCLGGVYLDIKSGARWPLDAVVGDHQYILTHWDNEPEQKHAGWGRHFNDFEHGEFQQWHICASPGHGYLAAVIARVLRNLETYCPQTHGVGRLGVLQTTGPIAYTQAIYPVLSRFSSHVARSHHAVGLVYRASDHYKQLYNSTQPHYAELDEPLVLRT